MAEFTTPFGKVRRDMGCRDDYDRLYVYDQPPLGSGVIILQSAAVRSLQRAEEAYAKKIWRPGLPKNLTQPIDGQLWKGEFSREKDKDGRRVFRPIYLTGSIRSCATQERLYRSDNRRYAKPEVTLHPHGLAIDVHTGFLNDTIRQILLNHGWEQSRPPGSDSPEPWHFSFTGTWMSAA